MTASHGVPEVVQNPYQWPGDALVVAIRDLACRAQALDALIDSAGAPRRLGTTRVEVSLDAGAWFAAAEIGIAPRPEGLAG